MAKPQDEKFFSAEKKTSEKEGKNIYYCLLLKNDFIA